MLPVVFRLTDDASTLSPVGLKSIPAVVRVNSCCDSSQGLKVLEVMEEGEESKVEREGVMTRKERRVLTQLRRQSDGASCVGVLVCVCG